MTTSATPAPPTFSARFGHFARNTARITGHPLAFLMAVLVIVGWAAMGPAFGFSDTWQLVINTGTTIVTFLMVFLIQNTQNRDAQAMQVKLDELIRAVEGAHNALVNLEDRDDEELNKLRRGYADLAERARRDVANGDADTQAIELGAEKIKEKAHEIGEKVAEIDEQAERVRAKTKRTK